MEDQTQSSLVTSNVDPCPGTAAKGSSGVSLERSVQPPALPPAPALSCAIAPEPVGLLSPSPVSSPPWTKATETPDAVLDRGPSSASKEAALSNTEKELSGAGVSDLQRAGIGAPHAGPEPGSVFGNYSWMTQPRLMFKKEEAEARTYHQVELVTGRDQATGESAKSDPSSIDSSQEEDSLERLTPDSPFEVLAEVQEKGTCEEACLKPLPASGERGAVLQEPKGSFFTGAVEKGPSGETAHQSKPETGVRTEAEGHNGPGAEDEKPSPLSDRRSPDQPGFWEEDPGVGGEPGKGEHTRSSTEAEGVEPSTAELALVDFQPTLAGSMSAPLEAFAPGPQEKGKSILGLEFTLDQGPSDVQAEAVVIPTTVAQSLGEVCPVQPAQPIMDKYGVSLAQPADAKTDANVPSPKRPSGGPMDDFWSLEEESKPPSSPHETPPVIKEPVSGQCMLGAPAFQTAAALDCVQPEPLEADSSGESEDTVIEDLKGPPGQQPLAQKVATEQQLASSSRGLQNLVLVPVISVTETAREQGVSDREEAAVSPVTSGAKETRNQPGAASDSKVEDQVGFGKASKVEDQVGFGKASKVEDQVGFGKASKVEDRAEVPGGDLPEGQAKGEVVGLTRGGIEPLKASPAPAVGDHPSEDHQPAAEEAGRRGPGASPVGSPVPAKPAPPPPSAPDLWPLVEMREPAVRLGGTEPGDPSAPLLEMIRRSELQREQLVKDKQAVPVPPAPEPVPTQSVIVTSTPVVLETSSIVVKPLKPPDGEPSDPPVKGEVGPLPSAPSRPSPRPVPTGAGAPPSGTVQESEKEEGGGAIPGGSRPASEDRRSPPTPPRTPALPLAVPASGAEQRDRDTPEAVVGGENAERWSRATVKDLIYWSDPKKTGMVFGSTLTLLVSLAVFSVVSVLAYLMLALLSVTISFRVYKSVVQAVQKVNDGNPFKAYLEQDITLSADTFRKYCDTALVHVNRALKYLLQLFLVQDLVDSLKLAVLMWLMTYVGAVFNGLTLLILAVLLTFSVPAIYKKYQKEIDHYVDLVQKQVCCAVGKIQEKLPGTKRKNE